MPSNKDHSALAGILHSRGMEKILPDKPLWKLKVNDDEYGQLGKGACV